MPIVLLEKKKGSRTATITADAVSSRLALRFLLVGTMDDLVIHTFLKSGVLPPTYGGMWKQDYTIDCIGWGAWDVTVNYAPLQPREPGFVVIEGEIGGGTQHITHSLGTAFRYSWVPNQSAPDYEGAIGVTKDTVEGCDIHAAGHTWSETHTVPAALVTEDYIDLLDWMSPSVNLVQWRRHAAGEVLFFGARYARQGADQWQFTYRFAKSRNSDSIKIGGDPSKVVSKQGWQYLWSRFADKYDNLAKKIVRAPLATYVENVYTPADFYDLGIL